VSKGADVVADRVKVAVCQMKVGVHKTDNLRKAVRMIEKAASAGACWVILPEMFVCPYVAETFHQYAEPAYGETAKTMAGTAARFGVAVFAGTIPESTGRDATIYNSCFVFDSRGNPVACHRKLHLFDVDIPGRIEFRESDVITRGDKVTTFSLDGWTVGLGICYDIRFPELSRLMVLQGAEVLVFPAAFNMTTGPAHWEVLFRARAVDNQAFTIGVSPAHQPDSAYVAYGHSIICDPWGRILSREDRDEGIIYATLDKQILSNVRKEMPLLEHLREDIYQLRRSRE